MADEGGEEEEELHARQSFTDAVALADGERCQVRVLNGSNTSADYITTYRLPYLSYVCTLASVIPTRLFTHQIQAGKPREQ